MANETDLQFLDIMTGSFFNTARDLRHMNPYQTCLIDHCDPQGLCSILSVCHLHHICCTKESDYFHWLYLTELKLSAIELNGKL